MHPLVRDHPLPLCLDKKLIRRQVTIENTTERTLRQARQDRRRGAIMGEAIVIMPSVYLIMGRYSATREVPPAHILWQMAVGMLLLIQEMLPLQTQEANDRASLGQTSEGAAVATFPWSGMRNCDLIDMHENTMEISLSQERSSVCPSSTDRRPFLT